jgi:hypothetical protein
MKKTLSTEDWSKIKYSFAKMNEKFPNALSPEDTPIYKYNSIKGVEEQIQELLVGKVAFYMDYSTPDVEPKLSKCEIIEKLNYDK